MAPTISNEYSRPRFFALAVVHALQGEHLHALTEQKLAEYTGVFDISNSSSAGGQEIRLEIKPEAEALGLTMASLGRQVRQAFYGEEAQRIQRGQDELKVMIRYPEAERRSIADLENMRIRTPTGDPPSRASWR